MGEDQRLSGPGRLGSPGGSKPGPKLGRRKGAEARAMAKHLGRGRDLPNEMPEASDRFWSAVRGLPDKQAQIVALHYADDQPVATIAEILGVSEGTVKTQLYRGRKTLTDTLGLEDDADDNPTEELPAPEGRTR